MSVYRSILLTLVVPAALTAQERTGDLFTWSGRVASGATLGIRHFNGPIDVRESTSDRVEFRAARPTRNDADLTFRVETVAGGVEICAVYRGRSACESGRRSGWDWDEGPRSSRLTVMLPRGVKLEARTGNGAVTVDKASNDVEIRSGNGDIRIAMTAGRVDASTGNGELEVDGATGPVQASTGNGRVFVVTSSGPVTVRTGNGDIDVRMRALANTANMDFVTGNGSVTVAVPANLNADIEARTGHGEFRSDFEIRVQGRLNPRNIRGTIGSGGSTIRMVSGNGRLELRRAN
jgi:Putative adhesin